MNKIYFDHAATSPVKKEVIETMKPYFDKVYGNPSSVHFFGQEARKAVEESREKVAEFLNCTPEEIVFTSGGTEADNLALRGIINYQTSIIKQKPHLITSVIEHHAILHTCQDLEKKELAQVSYLPVDKWGQVSVSDVKKAIKENTVLVSIMYANNEIGTIQPIKEIGKLILNIKNKKSKIVFHTDAVQAIEYLNCDVNYLGVDLLSLSAHKFGGPKGVGALFIRKNTGITPRITGGEQENKMRAGTENVPGIVGLGKAIQELRNKNDESRIKKIQQLRDKLIDGIMRKIRDVILTGHPENRLPNSASFCFKYIEGESILISLDLEGVAVATGSACTSSIYEPSHVLLASGIKPEVAQGSIRITLGEQNTKEEVEYLLKTLPPIVKRLRKMSPLNKKG